MRLATSDNRINLGRHVITSSTSCGTCYAVVGPSYMEDSIEDSPTNLGLNPNSWALHERGFWRGLLAIRRRFASIPHNLNYRN